MPRQRGRRSSHKYSVDVRCTESGSIIRAGSSKGHCPELEQKNKTGKGFGFTLSALWQAWTSQVCGRGPQKQMVLVLRGWEWLPHPGLGASTPPADSVLNDDSHQKHGWALRVFLSLKTNQGRRSILQTFSSFPISSRDQ